MGPLEILNILETALTVTPPLIANFADAVSTVKSTLHGNTLSSQQMSDAHSAAFLALAHLKGASEATARLGHVMSQSQIDEATAHAATLLPIGMPHLTPEQQATIAVTPNEAVTAPAELPQGIPPSTTPSGTVGGIDFAEYQEFLAFKKFKEGLARAG
mgnify:CR=1 FL=1